MTNPIPMSPYRSQFLGYTPTKPDAYTPYAAGRKQYGAAGLPNPTSGPITSTTGLEGYQDRERRAAVARQASLNMLQAGQQGRYLSSDWLGGQVANGRR